MVSFHRVRKYCIANCICRRFFFFLIFTCLFVTVASAGDKTEPFHPGEKLVFELKWTIVSAGEATLQVLPIKKVNGNELYHFALTAKTNKFFDNIYKVRDRIDAYTDLQMTHSLYYLKKQREGKTKKNVHVKFYWDKNEAVYNDILKGKKRKPVSLLPGAFDPLSIFYFARSLPMNTNMVLERPVTDGKKCVVGKTTIVKRETITVKAGTFDTFLIEPELKHVGGVFKKSENAKIELWITADEKKIPVKLKSEVVVGSFSAELVSYNE
jgi:hypothetical protein